MESLGIVAPTARELFLARWSSFLTINNIVAVAIAFIVSMCLLSLLKQITSILLKIVIAVAVAAFVAIYIFTHLNVYF